MFQRLSIPVILLGFLLSSLQWFASTTIAAQEPSSQTAPTKQRPNVLFVLTDDQRWGLCGT